MTTTIEAASPAVARSQIAVDPAEADTANRPDRLGRRRLARHLGFLAYLALVMAGAVFVVKPSALAWSGGFIAGHQAPGAPPFGDHLQIAYYLWLWAHAIAGLAHVPWTDPYQFTGLGHQLAQPFGWPLVLISVPVDLVAGPVAAYNILVLLAFPACAAATYWLARSLGLSPLAGAVAGFAYAFEPFRMLQGTGHINALLAPLLPLLITCVELALRRRGRPSRMAAWGAAVVFVSIMASGELQVAVYAALLLVGWVVLRAPPVPREHLRTLVRPLAILVAGAAGLAAVDMIFVLGPSVASTGQPAVVAAAYAPSVHDLFSLGPTQIGEHYIYPGMVIAALAGLGLVTSLLRRGRRLLVCALVLGLGVTAFLAIGPSLTRYPAIAHASRAVPPLSLIRVPGRIDIVAGVLLALLAALGIESIRPPVMRLLVTAVALVGIVAELPAGFYGSNPVPPTLRAVPSQSVVLDLPPFNPGDGRASTYGYEGLGHPIRIAGGYSPFATPAIFVALGELSIIAGVPVSSCLWGNFVARYSIQYVAVHVGLYDISTAMWHTTGEAVVAALDRTPGFTQVGVSEPGRIVTFKLDRSSLVCGIEPPEPATQVLQGNVGGPEPGPPVRR